MALEGIEVRPIKQMTGDSEFCEVFFTDVSMPSDSLLGEVNEGWGVAMAVLEDERGGAGAAGVMASENVWRPWQKNRLLWTMYGQKN